MSWSNGGRGLSRRSRFDGGVRKKLPSNYLEAQTVARPLPRPGGVALWAHHAKSVVAAAFGRTNLIRADEPHEHLLVVVDDGTYFHAYHFIVAPPRGPGERRRVLMVTERTHHFRIPLEDRDDSATVNFLRVLAQYAAELPNAQLIINKFGCCAVIDGLLTSRMSNDLQWRAVEMKFPPSSPELANEYSTYYDCGFTRYCEALREGSIDHPDLMAITRARVNVPVARDFTGKVAIKRPDLMFGRDITALSLVYVDEELRRIGVAAKTYTPKLPLSI